MADGELLNVLRDEAATLVETEIPASEELRPIVGALLKALDRVVDVDALRAPQTPVSDATGGVPVTSAPPVPSVADQPVVVADDQEREQAQDSELDELRAKVAELEAERDRAGQNAAPSPTASAPVTTSTGDAPSTGTWQEPAPAAPASPTTTEGQSA